MKKISMFFGFAMLGLAAVAAFGVIVMWLWNWLLPTIFGVGVIDFWQALGILVLSKILFGSFGFRGSQKHFHNSGSNLFREKWQQMSEDERREFLKHRKKFSFMSDFFKHENEKSEG